MERCAACLLWFLLPLSGLADLIAGWEVKGIELDDGSHQPPYVVAANTTAVHVAAAEISLSGAVNPSTSSNEYGFKVSSPFSTNSLAGAIQAAHYMQFIVTAAEDYVLNLTHLTMYGQSSGTGCDDVGILSSVDGFAEGRAIATAANIAGLTGGFDTDASGFGAPIDLSAAKFSRLKSITFRIYGWKSTGGTGITYLRNLTGHDLVLNGTVEYVPPAGGVIMFR